MAQIVNTNVASLNAQRNLNRSQSMLGTSLERISSGLRVNSAKDDAAGLAISNRLQAQVRGFNQAARNAADAVSLAQTGEGSLAEVTNNLQRMREIAVQSRNATNTVADRQSLDAEFQQLLAENDRIAQTTAFNGRNVLDGTMGSAVFQVGANVGETVAIDLGAGTSMRSGSVGQHAAVTYTLGSYTDQGHATGFADAGLLDANTDLDINGVSIDAAVNGANGLTNGSAQSIVNAINAKRDGVNGHGVTATASTTSLTITAANIAAYSALAEQGGGTDDTLTYVVTMNGTNVFTANEGEAAFMVAQLVSKFNAVSATTGVTAAENSDGSMTLSTSDGRNIHLLEKLNGDTDNADTVTGYFGQTALTGTANAESRTIIKKGSISLSAAKTITTALAGGSANIFGVGSGGSGPANGASADVLTAGLDASDVLSTTNADTAINRIDQALSDVDGLRGTFGAIQSRFESTIRNLQTSAENASAANSRIVDADFAAETAALTRAQILQQAGVSILAQANALPQNALALLQ